MMQDKKFELSSGSNPQMNGQSLRIFLWDRITKIQATILAVFFIFDNIVKIFISPLSPPGVYIECDADSDVMDTVVKHCRHQLANMPDYLQYIVLSQVILFNIMPYWWTTLWSRKINTFVSAINRLISLKESERRSETTSDEICKLHKTFSKSKKLYWSYLLLKFCLPITISATYLLVLLHFGKNLISLTFTCSNMSLNIWPIEEDNVTCIVYPFSIRIRLLSINYVVLGVITFTLLCGLCYMLVLPFHTNESEYRDRAEFIAYTGLKIDNFAGKCHDSCKWSLRTSPNDFHFLLLQIHSSAAKIIKGMLTENEVNRIKEEKYYYSTNQCHMGVVVDGLQLISGISGITESLINGRKCIGILVSHNNDIMTYMLRTQFFEKVLGINFNSACNSNDSSSLTTFHQGVPNTMQIPKHTWSWDSSKADSNMVREEVMTNMNRLVEGLEEYDVLMIFMPTQVEYFTQNHVNCQAKKVVHLIPKDATNIYVLTYYPKSIGKHKPDELFLGMRSGLGIPLFLHQVYISHDGHRCMNTSCNQSHWKLLKDKTALISSTFGSVECFFQVDVYHYEQECQTNIPHEETGEENPVVFINHNSE